MTTILFKRVLRFSDISIVFGELGYINGHLFLRDEQPTYDGAPLLRFPVLSEMVDLTFLLYRYPRGC